MIFRSVQSFCIFVFLSIGFPYMIYSGEDLIKNNFDLSFFLSFCIIIYSSVKLSNLTLKGENRLIEMTFWLFVYVWLGITSLGHSLLRVFAWNTNYSSDEIVRVQLLIICSLIFYELGMKLNFKKNSKKFNEEKKNKKTIKMNFSSIFLLFLLFFCISMLMIFLSGGLYSLFSTRFEQGLRESDSLKSMNLIMDSLKKTPIFSLLVYVIIEFKNKKYNPSDKNKFLLLIIIMFFINIIISNPIANPRFWFGAVFLTLLLISFKWKKIYMGIYIFFLSLILTVVFPYMDTFRVSLESKLTKQNVAYLLLVKGDYDAFQQIMNALRVVELKGFTFGEQLLGVIFFWFPRSLWEGKPISTGAFVGENLNYLFTNFSSPLWAEFYINFGVIGVMIMFFFYGKLTYFMQNKMLIKSNLSFYMISYFFAAYQIFFLRGDLLNAVAYLTPFIVVTIIINKVLNVERKTYEEKNSIRN
nr:MULTISPECIES: O-antigen polymerase [unclassified Exiguobacterium]